MSEFAPAGGTVKMSKSQVKKYVKDMKKAQAIARAKLEQAKLSGAFQEEENELTELENKLDELL